MGDVIRHVLIRGSVQGVGFRYWTRRTAAARGLQGWVRNRGRDSVEAGFGGLAQGATGLTAPSRAGPASAPGIAGDVTPAPPDAPHPRPRGARGSGPPPR